ncbi:phosphatidylethanolamine-binding protein (PEBP) family [Ceratobasidium sp. AG-Ba]|nr:phosphatidylethanolamine-binding protein (PEBP) family [Ceratobasidium sp. AG-Ba]QRW06846.1 phosphatidylethanolamine-binding protein (PEBP) family [Ceratobasidium sp. AG-Ba]
MKFSILAVLSVGSIASTLALSKACPYPSLSEVRRKFYEAGIVPDVLPTFDPKAFLYLTYTGNLSDGSTSKTVLPGISVARNDTLHSPELSVTGLKSGPYVVALIDPDAPSRAKPTFGQVRHLLAANLTVAGTRSKYVHNSFLLNNSTPAVNDYLTPTPPAGSGPHRYVALLYTQPRHFDISFLNVSDILNFNISSFAHRARLGEPLAGTFMTVEVRNTTMI